MKKILVLILVSMLILSTVAFAVGGSEVKVRVTDGEDNPVSGARVRMKVGLDGYTNWFTGGVTDGAGETSAMFDVGVDLYLQAEVDGNWSAWQNKTLVDGITNFNFSQEPITAKVTDGEGDPLANVKIRKKYGESGYTMWLPGETDANGEVVSSAFMGTDLYLQATNGTDSAWQNQIVVDGGNTYVFSTTDVYVVSDYRVSFGGPTGQSWWLDDSTRHIFAGTYVFHFNGLGRINLPVSGDKMDLLENGMEFSWRPPVSEGMVISNKNKSTPFKFRVEIAGYPMNRDDYYVAADYVMTIAGENVVLECDPDIVELKSIFKVRDSGEIIEDGSYEAEVKYNVISKLLLGFNVEIKKW